MNIAGIVIATLLIGVVGLLIGLLLGVADKKFQVETDEREIRIREVLPGNNCGGCGYAGCDGLAAAIAGGSASVNACPVGGESTAAAIGDIMGVSADGIEKQVAFVMCNGSCDKTERKYNYYGIADCRQVMTVPGKGEKLCEYGCMGYGSCVEACKFDAIHIIDGIAAVDREACISCGKCVAACPKNLIELVPYKAEYLVQCSSKDKGKAVKEGCQVGCIACMLCTKQCEHDAIKVTNNLAKIDYDICINCGKCAQKCPVQCIKYEKKY